MNKLTISLENCYGIKKLETNKVDFTKSNSCAIYAPNGCMKTSFTKTFTQLSKGDDPKEERHGEASTWSVKVDGIEIEQDAIYVLESEIDSNADTKSVTDILVDRESKQRYDQIILERDSLKKKLATALQKESKVPTARVINEFCNDLGSGELACCIEEADLRDISSVPRSFRYAVLFDSKVLSILNSHEFLNKAEEFNTRYNELFEEAGSIYSKGAFNPHKADATFSILKKNGYFEKGHRVHFQGEESSIDKDELEAKLEGIHSHINNDQELKKLRDSLTKDAKTTALLEIIEMLPAHEVEYLIVHTKPDKISDFKKDLWAVYIENMEASATYLEHYHTYKNELTDIENAAGDSVPQWENAVDLFNNRFIDMPFTLSVENLQDARIGRAPARLVYTFKDAISGNELKQRREEITTLSQGEKRAIYLLNFIFDVEVRKMNFDETLFIIDDIADSFDYKNKHAILLYLKDLSQEPNFRQIILTHNFDFFRALFNGFVNRKLCLMANKSKTKIELFQAGGVKNVFTGIWKERVVTSKSILYATIPFTRNLLEYTKGDEDPDYLKLTNLLHWKKESAAITVQEYLDIYNEVFHTTHSKPEDWSSSLIELLFTEADVIDPETMTIGLNLEQKVLLSIAIRIKAEQFIINQLRIEKSAPDFWPPQKKAFGDLLGENKESCLISPHMSTLEKVSVTVSSNIHLNAFMYEPILDLSIDHLVDLYNKIKALPNTSQIH